MKVLFVGEGDHEIGKSEGELSPRPARGVLPCLCRKIVPHIEDASVAIRWRELKSRRAERGSPSLARKVVAAAILAKAQKCGGVVCVVDQDRDRQRRKDLKTGADTVRKKTEKLRIVTGVAIESIEAWTLGAPAAIAKVLGAEPSEVEKEYPKGKEIEELSNRSENRDQRPKEIIKKIAELWRKADSTEFRERVAQETDIAQLEENCPRGFKPFAAELRSELRTTDAGR